MTEPIDSELERLEEELRPYLSRVLSRSPKTEETTALIRSLQPEFDQITKEKELLPFNERIRVPSFWRLILSQIGTYRRGFWLMSLALFTMLTLVAGGLNPSSFGEIDLFSLSLPLFLILTFAHSYRSRNREMRMVEQITPFPPAFLLLTRILIPLGMNLFFGLVGSAWLHLTSRSYALATHLPGWIAPLLLSAGLLAYFIFRFGIGAGFSFSIITWAGYIGLKGWMTMTDVWDRLIWTWLFDGAAAGIGLFLLLLTYRRLLRHPYEGEERIR